MFTVRAPLIAEERKPGQFVILQLDDDFGERIPLTIADADPAEGSITLIFQAVGKTTHELGGVERGRSDREPGRPARATRRTSRSSARWSASAAASAWRPCTRSPRG